MTLEIGNKAPDFSLEINGGKEVSLGDFKGKKLVIFIYPKDDTSGCTKEAIAFSENKDQFDKLNTVILGLSKDSVKSHEKFINKHDLKIDLLSDEDCKLIDAFGSWVEKSMYGKKYMGADRSTFIINEEGNISSIFRKVKVKDHVEAVLEEVKKIS